MNTPGNTFAEAAIKLGLSLRTLQRKRKSRAIEIVRTSERKLFITDDAIERYKARRTIRAII